MSGYRHLLLLLSLKGLNVETQRDLIYFSSFAVAMEVMVVMVMVGTVISLKMGCVTPEWDTLFSLRVPIIIWRISLLASPRTDSSAWMCSSLRRHSGCLQIRHNNTSDKTRKTDCMLRNRPDIRVFGHQSRDLQKQQCGVSQLQHFSNGSNRTTQPICVFTLHTTNKVTHTSPNTTSTLTRHWLHVMSVKILSFGPWQS